MRLAAVSVAVSACLLPVVAVSQLSASVFSTGYSSPVSYVQDSTATNRGFVLQQNGVIKTVINGIAQATNFLDVSSLISTGSERGLLGMALDPNYASNGRIYLNFTDSSGNTQIARFTRNSGNPNIADFSSRLNILNVAQPFSNHNGGSLKFGPDGFMYIGMGDGGSSNDPGNRAQNPTELLGKMLRIDVNGDAFPGDPNTNYAIPAGNPFAGADALGARDEIWAFGLRNPWKFSWDSATGAMLIADVGQGNWEEIDYEPAATGGRNYGWKPREGRHTLNGGAFAYGPVTDPFFEYDHSVGQSITGGHIYRGSALGAAFQGKYFFGDYVAKKFWGVGLTFTGGEADQLAFGAATEYTSLINAALGATPLGNVSSIDVNAGGEILIVDYSNGRLIQLQPVPEPGTLFGLALGSATLLRRRHKRMRAQSEKS